MPYYHVYIAYTDKRGKEQDLIYYDLGEKDVSGNIANPYMENKKFLCLGRILHPSNIEKISIFKSEKEFRKLVLPNGKTPIGQSNQHIMWCFSNGQVEGVEPCTLSFIISLPKEKEEPTKTPTKPLGKKEKIFIVHGRDDKQALLLQKYLTRTLKKNAIMFDDLPDKGKTIIEQLEYVRDNVGYAFAIVTPDDVGCLVEDIDQVENVMTRGRESLKVEEVDEILDTLLTRPRQNVIFELGLFISALGRDKVCYLLQKDVKDIPSDLQGILFKSFDKSVKEVFQEIADELKED